MNHQTKRMWIKAAIAFMIAYVAATAALLAFGCSPTEPIIKNIIIAPPPAPLKACDDIMDQCGRCPRDVTVTGSRMTFRVCYSIDLVVEMVFTDWCVNPVILGSVLPDVIETGEVVTYSGLIPPDAGAVHILVIDHGEGFLYPCEWTRP